MNGRDNVLAAYAFKPPYKIPVEYYYSPVGYYEHGDKLNDLFSKYEGDFEPFAVKPVPVLPPEAFDADGRYHEIKTDEWGTEWEYRIFGVWGIERKYPLSDYSKLADYSFPPLASYINDRDAFLNAKKAVENHKIKYFSKGGALGLFEKLISLRPFEDVLCDMAAEDDNFISLLDRLTERNRLLIDSAIRLEVDSIAFGDDFGTQDGLIFSREMFKRYFMTRYKSLMKPIKEAGIKVHFHTCGNASELLDDFKEMGVDSIWPQLPAYDLNWLADKCRDLNLAVALHTDRANTMTHGTPEEVRTLVKSEYEAFKPDKGGSWFYIEVDNGFPFDNIKALVEQVFEYR